MKERKTVSLNDTGLGLIKKSAPTLKADFFIIAFILYALLEMA